jgi:hypothetical protein
MLLSMISCGTITLTDTATGASELKVVLYMFNEIVCFSGAHILHGCIALIASLLLSALTFLIILIFYESRRQQNIILSK